MGPLSATGALTLRQRGPTKRATAPPCLWHGRAAYSTEWGVGLGEPKSDERKPRLQLIPGSRASYLNKWLTAEPMSQCFEPKQIPLAATDLST